MSHEIVLSNNLLVDIEIILSNTTHNIPSKESIEIPMYEGTSILRVLGKCRVLLRRDREYIFPLLEMEPQSFPIVSGRSYLIDPDDINTLPHLIDIILSEECGFSPWYVDYSCEYNQLSYAMLMLDRIVYNLGYQERYDLINIPIDGILALEAAVLRGWPELVARLVEPNIGADPNLSTNSLGLTLLEQLLYGAEVDPIAVELEPQMIEIVNILLQAGAFLPPYYDPALFPGVITPYY